MVRIITFIFLAVTVLVVQVPAQADAISGQKAVLVTGASSGLGRVMAETLAASGHFVYAGARKDKDIQELNASRMSRPSGWM